METLLLRTFQSQVALQCKYLLTAAKETNAALQRSDPEAVFYALQNLLNAGANISKALWGSGGKFSVERKPLRDSIGVSDASPLRQVTMRNNFEHFDERIDRWWATSKRRNIVDMNVGLPSGADDIDIFRNFNPRTTEVVFGGQGFNLQEIADEVLQLLPKLEIELNKRWD